LYKLKYLVLTENVKNSVLTAGVVIRFGVMEYWSTGVLEKADALDLVPSSLSITPLLQHSTTPASSREQPL
jgi:hypothetical protein